MSTHKFITLIEKLSQKNQIGGITWMETEKEGVYQTVFPRYSIRISVRPSPNNPFSNDYVLSIFNETGALIEEVSDTDLHGMSPDAFSTLKELYESARSIAMGVDAALDDVIKDLDSGLPW